MNTDTSSYTSVTLDGKPALQSRIQGIGLVDHLFIDNGNNFLHLQGNSTINKEENMKTYSKILSTFKFTDQEQVACTQEAKLCPDGKTYVARQGHNCEFASCPN